MLHWDQYLGKAEEPLLLGVFKALARQCHCWPDPASAITLLKSGAGSAGLPSPFQPARLILGSLCTSTDTKELIIVYLIKA